MYNGYLEKYLWRDEKEGKTIFFLCIEQEPFEALVCGKIIKNNATYYRIACVAEKFPLYEKGTPLRVKGTAMNLHVVEGRSMNLRIDKYDEYCDNREIAISFLSSLVTKRQAEIIVDNLGPNVFEYRAESLIGVIPDKKAKRLIEVIKGRKAERSIMDKYPQLPYSFVSRAVKQYGSDALDNMESDPYKMGIKLKLPLSKIDEIAKASGISGNDRRRIVGIAHETLKILSNQGHTWAALKDFNAMFQRVSRTEQYPQEASGSETYAFIKDIVEEKDLPFARVAYDRKIFETEARLARNILRLAVERPEPSFSPGLVGYAESECKIQYGSQQKAAVTTVLRATGLKILTGGPGTGKTSTIKGIITAYKQMHPNHIIKLCAPTGRAAQRMSESTGYPATTIHRLLEYQPFGDQFSHKDASDPIKADFIVVDEMSMVDIEVFDLFLEAVVSGTNLLLVGDTDQLEPVGAGAVLRDMLKYNADNIPHIRLFEVFRQKNGSAIIENSIRIRRGVPQLKTAKDFTIVRTENAEESAEVIRKISKYYFNPSDPFETQVLCPARKGTAGVNESNRFLQALLNPTESCKTVIGGITYKKGDKILLTNNNYELDYYNGDIGLIKDAAPGFIEVTVRGRDIKLEAENLDDISLAYSMTIHKSQGSEFKNVIVVLPQDPKNMLTRNLIYTGITRGKANVIIVSEGDAMERSIRTDVSGRRKTFLDMFLNGKIRA